MLWAAIHLPQRAIDAVLRRQPEPEAPLALVEGPPQRRQVLLANAAAREAGVQAGQALTAALALCPSLAVAGHDAAEADALLELACAWAYGYSGQVCSEPALDTVWLEVGGSLGLFGPWPRFERLLRDDLQALGLEHRIGLAPTPLAALCLARHRDGLAVTAIEPLRQLLDHLPIATLPLQDATREALAALGVRRLRQLLALPRAGLRRRFGAELGQWLDRLTGAAPDPRPAYRPPERFERRFEFDDEIRYHTGLLFPLRRLLTDLAGFLAGRDGGVQRFHLRFEHELQAPSQLQVGSAVPERDPARLFELARLVLERETLPAPVRALSVCAEELPPFVPPATDLFDTRPAGALDWPALQARLQARLDAEAVHRYVLQPDPRPERAMRRVREDVPGEARIATPLPRPTWLLARPIPLRGPAPTVLAGPERIESGWWDGEDLRRDYYVVRTGNGQRAWVFCPAGERGPWMLHGWFA